MISQKGLKQFKIIWKEEFGSDISDKDAMGKASELLTLFDAIYKPIKKDWLKLEQKN